MLSVSVSWKDVWDTAEDKRPGIIAGLLLQWHGIRLLEGSLIENSINLEGHIV